MDFFEFLEIMKNIPDLNETDILCKSNVNFSYLDNLASQGYFKLLNPTQKYHLFVTACAYGSVDIAILLYKNSIDMEGLKEFMLNYLVEISDSSEYYIFRWIWEKKSIEFTQEEIIECFIKILKSGNLEFAEWFCSLGLVDLTDPDIKKTIINDILELADTTNTYTIAKLICKEYLKKNLIESN